jgi:hypothetical protein
LSLLVIVDPLSGADSQQAPSRWGLVLGQVAVPEAAGASSAVLGLAGAAAPGGETVIVDAASTRWAATEDVAQRGAYRMMVKADQPTPPRACALATS